MQSPTRISWSGYLSSCSLNKWPAFPQANTPTYGSQNISSNSVTGWDDEGAPMYIFWSLHHRWWQGLTFDNLWHHRWCRLQKMYIGSSSSVMCKQVLTTSGVLHTCPLLSSWYFSYMSFNINFWGNKSPLMTILHLFRASLACYPG